MWQEPKLNWADTDCISYIDLNRIAGNLQHVRDMFSETSMDGWINISTKSEGADILASQINEIENNLELLNNSLFALDIGEKKVYTPNGYTINYEELNRIESATQLLRGTSISYNRLRKHLEIKLKDNHYKYVPRVKVIRQETMDNRFDWRLGQMKGAKF